MTPVAPATAITAPPQGLAQVIFLRPNRGIVTESDIALYRIARERTPIAPLPEGFQLVHNISPGNHTFMGYQNGKAHFIEASLAAGKRYYILIEPINSKENALLAVTQQLRDQESFKQWLSLPAISSQLPNSVDWYQQHNDKVDSAQVVSWQRWQQRDSADQRKFTLNSQDGISP